MASLNKVFLLGNLTRDPDLRFTPSGSAVCEMGLAVSRKFVANDREQEEVCFVDIVIWGKQAESCKQYLSKGAPALIEGRLQFDQWEDKNGGGKRSRLRVVADRVQFVGAKRGDNSGESYGGNSGDYSGNNSGNYGQSNSYGGNSNNNNNSNYRQAPPQSPQGRPAVDNNPFAAPPAMPQAAFNPVEESEDDIPF